MKKTKSTLPAITKINPLDPLNPLKQHLAAHIRVSMAAKKLDQTQTAKLVKTTRLRMNKICMGNLQKITVDSLLGILVHLGNEIVIEVMPIQPLQKIKLVSQKGTKKIIA